MEGLFLFLFWAIVIGLSVMNKAQERRKIEERQRERAERSPKPANDASRRRVYGGAEPKVATAKRGNTAPTSGHAPRTTTKEATPKPVEQQVLERFFGVDMDNPEEMPQQVADRTREVVERLRGQVTGTAPAAPPPVPKPQLSQEEISRRERKLRERTANAKRTQELARQRAITKQPKRKKRTAGTTARLFATPSSVRDAIIVNTILNPPKAFESEERGVF